MAKLIIDLKKCVGCGLCAKSCASGALYIKDKKAFCLQEKCIFCSTCVSSCPLKAISIENEKNCEIDISSYKDIWVFAELQGGSILPVAYELTAKGAALAKARSCKVTALVFGSDSGKEAESLIEEGADRVLYCSSSIFDELLEDQYTDLICELIIKHKPEVMLFGATTFGRSLAPRVAARIGTGLTADCTGLEIQQDKGLLLQTRPAFGGNLMATIVTPYHRPQIATVRPGVFASEKPMKKQGTALEVPFEGEYSRVKLLKKVIIEKTEGIADAKIIVSAGRGILAQKNIHLIYRLAELLGAAVGVTRPLVDMGWCEYQHQIGQTGSVVAPEVLVCFGVSGAIQHLAGIAGAKRIIAINNDPKAPIFDIAEYKILGDSIKILKEMIECLEDEKS